MRHRPPIRSFAYHLIWTTYGTWLPGDCRGWRRRGDPAPRPPSPVLFERCRELLKYPPLFLDPHQRMEAFEALTKTCRARGWTLHAHTVQRAHVHLVVSPPYTPDITRTQLKGAITRALTKRWPELGGRTLWARDGWTTDLHSPAEIGVAIAYVYDDHHDT